MGFFDIAKKIFKGEPVFSVPPQQDQGQQAPEQQQAQPSQGPKVLPQVLIERWLCTEDGAGLQCEVSVRNYSKAGVTLDKIEMLGLHDQLGEHLEAGEHYEYHFSLPKRPSDTHLDECDLYFKNEAGDYFLAKHQIEFEKQPDGTFSILRFRLVPPIRDV